MDDRVVCDCCNLISDRKNTTFIKDKNLSGMVVCYFCLNDNNTNHVNQQIKWLKSLRNDQIKSL